MSTSTEMPVQKPAKRWRWWRVVLGLLAILIAGPAAWLEWSRLAMEREWAAAVAEAEEDTPRWTLLELEEDRAKVPDEENSALFIIAVAPKIKPANVSGTPNYELIFAKLPPNVQLNGQQEQIIRAGLGRIGAAREEARIIKDMPRGRFPVKYSDDAYSTLIPNHWDARGLADVLKHDAFLLAQDRDFDKAVNTCRAGLNLRGSMQDDLLLVALWIRVAMNAMALDALERVLAQGEASEESLRAMQVALERECGENPWLAAIRGERAMTHHFFENARSGKVKMASMVWLLGMVGGGSPSFPEKLLDSFPSLILKYYPEHLRAMNRCVEIAKLPIHERGPELAAWEKDLGNSQNILMRGMGTGWVKVHQDEIRNHASLPTAAVAVACERYRLKHKVWPATLAVLVQEKLIGAIPTDPIDNQPLRYRRTKEGVVIYSIGIDKADNGGAINRERPQDPGADVGFRLWDESQRRLPPRPPVGIPEVAASTR